MAWSPLIGGYFRSGLSPELARLSGLDLHRLVRAHPIRLCTEPPEGVRRHAREVLESAAGHPNFILSTGDAVAAGTTIEQLRAVAHAVRGVYGGGLTAFVDQGFP